jgi:hypothetical protein
MKCKSKPHEILPQKSKNIYTKRQQAVGVVRTWREENTQNVGRSVDV